MSIRLMYCGYLEQEVLELDHNHDTVTDGLLRKQHSIVHPLSIVCTCAVTSKTKFALTKHYLYYTYKNTLMRHDMRNSLKRLMSTETVDYEDSRMLDTGKYPIISVQSGCDFVTVVFKNTVDQSVTLILSDDGSSCTLDMGEDKIVNNFAYGKQFGIVYTIDKKLIRIQREKHSKDISMEDLELPNKVEISTENIELSCGKEHAMVLQRDGQILVLGGGSRGQMGNGFTESACQPLVVDTLDPLRFSSVCAGGWHCVALSRDGDLYAWGWNESGQVGCEPCLPDVGLSLGMGSRDSNISEDSEGNCNLKSENNVSNFQETMESKHREPIMENFSKRNVKEEQISKLVFLPQLVDTPLDEQFVSVSAGTRHTCAVSERGELYTWGWNGYGQLFHGDAENRYVPMHVQFRRYSNVFVENVICSDWGTLIQIK